MAAPSVISPVSQQGNYDCVIAALSTLLSIPYPDVKKAAHKEVEDPKATGISVRECQFIAKRLTGRTFQSVRPDNAELNIETGILFCKVPGGYHAVVLFEGILFNPQDGLVWNYETYLASKKAHPVRFLRP